MLNQRLQTIVWNQSRSCYTITKRWTLPKSNKGEVSRLTHTIGIGVEKSGYQRFPRLISTDLIPLKKLTQNHPTSWAIDLCQQLQLAHFAHLANSRLSNAGTLNKQVVELAEIYLPLPQNLWNSLTAAPESVPCSFNTVLVDERTSLTSVISEEECIVHLEPVLQIDPHSLAPLQRTKFSKA